MDVRSLVNDARVLLGQLQRSPWRDLHVRTPNGEIFIARPGGGPNPMRRAVADARVVPQGGQPFAGTGLLVRAPHVGSVVEVAPVDTAIEAGGIVCRLVVLDEIVEIASPAAGVIGEVFAVHGAFVEFESPLVTIVSSQ